MSQIPAFMQGLQACNQNSKSKCSLPCDPAVENCEDDHNEIR